MHNIELLVFSVERLSDVNHIERIVRSGDGEVDSEDEFFDCKEVPEDLRSLTKWNSMELVPDQENDYSGKTDHSMLICVSLSCAYKLKLNLETQLQSKVKSLS